ncbi:MAG: hypothetical protein QE290_14465 [Acidovorax sp.]|uniref:hypothetical protein n=1 Tax=Acidovorax sp. TaxID=1872122 RepID=UPI002619E370|nr:hypothetical protein [Acidovorax sp.]MDH4465224.1 hypothetical protein [Acidovorax sp.]
MTQPRCPTGLSEITCEVGHRDIDGKIEAFVAKQIPLACLDDGAPAEPLQHAVAR